MISCKFKFKKCYKLKKLDFLGFGWVSKVSNSNVKNQVSAYFFYFFFFYTFFNSEYKIFLGQEKNPDLKG